MISNNSDGTLMTPEEAKRLSRGISSDMSPEAISRRLEIVSQLFRLGSALSRAKYIGRVEDVRAVRRAAENASEADSAS
jgi:hypothetical protein